MKDDYIDFDSVKQGSTTSKLEAINLIVQNDFEGALKVVNDLLCKQPVRLPVHHLDSMSIEDLHRVLNLKIADLELEARVKNALTRSHSHPSYRRRRSFVYLGDLLCSDSLQISQVYDLSWKGVRKLERSLRALGVSLNDDPRGWSRPNEN